jgi:hypothetical protein
VSFRLLVGAGVVCAVLLAGGAAARAVPPGWPRYVDSRNGFELQLPPGWKTGTSFLTTHAYAVLRRRIPSAARGYAAMLRAAPGHGVLFIAVDSSTISLEHALRFDGGSYGLFPAIFVVRGSRNDMVPVDVHDFVVPFNWAAGTLNASASNCRPTFGRQIVCNNVYRTYLGDVYVDFWRVPGARPGRAPLVAGFVRGQLLEPNGGLLADPATPVWEAVRAIIRYR